MVLSLRSSFSSPSSFNFLPPPPPPGKSSSSEGQYQVSLGSLLDDQHWHHVTIERRSARLNLTVDKVSVWVQIPPMFARWDHDRVCFFYATDAHNHKKYNADFLHEKKKTKNRLFSSFFVCTDECGSQPRLWPSELSGVTWRLSWLFGKPELQRVESNRPGKTKIPAGQSEGNEFRSTQIQVFDSVSRTREILRYPTRKIRPVLVSRSQPVFMQM